ncbi:alpha/beta hydrolase [Pseudarthrobacter phenanthrenivorans]|uniref:Alpha/beta hydrolase n=1 Tax=Pseudarthrobacter phenanthrenivorans TaxID=361575 RepID=A0A3B0FN43_PSEPS|nr:alpha/beta hydrolase [Pseudarthrobacter phenanthrenivorans]RKO21319.1 alpha/beta hydrolase [Pseudarthrobacter phenanthrenivorans]
MSEPARRGPTGAPTTGGSAGTAWAPDILGPGFQQRILPLAPDDEGDVCATLVRCTPQGQRGTTAGQDTATQDTAAQEAGVNVVLYVHGWADYFLQAEVAEYLANAGFPFYAVDLRKFGRSLRPWQTPGFTEDLAVYDEDLAAALGAIREDLAEELGPEARPVVHLLAHSLGGLIAALWADRNPGALGTLILNAPWLELQGSSIIRTIAMHLVDPLSRTDPRRPLWLPEMPGYWQSVSNEAHGEWHLDPLWRPRASFPIRAGWAKAVLAGHAAVERRLDIRAPTLVLLSARTRIQIEWSAELMEADAVIDVEETANRSLRLGRRVAVFRYPGAIHDVFLSRRAVREEACGDLAAWLRAYPA